MPKKVKQVSIQLPTEVIQRATTIARNTRRPDGLKQTRSQQLRLWLLRGMQQEEVRPQ